MFKNRIGNTTTTAHDKKTICDSPEERSTEEVQRHLVM